MASALALVPLQRADFPLLVEWLALPHVARWWGPPKSLEEVEAEFGPCFDGTDPTKLFICTEDDQPIGMVQIYLMADNPEYVAALGFNDAAALDLFIGEPSACNRGLGPRIIALATECIWSTYPDVPGALASPSVHNLQSIRTFNKAGFRSVRAVRVPGEVDEEMVVYRERPTAG